jgi:hypothetical protein
MTMASARWTISGMSIFSTVVAPAVEDMAASIAVAARLTAGRSREWHGLFT